MDTNDICCSSISAACLKFNKSYMCCEKCIEWYITCLQKGTYKLDEPSSDSLSTISFLKEQGYLDIHMVARFCNNLDLFKKLLDFYNNVNVSNNFGQTILSFCVSHDKLDFVKHLIDKGADVTIAENSGTTLLHIVRDYEIAKILLDCGAKIHINTRLSYTNASPLYYLVGRSSTTGTRSGTIKDIIQLFLDNGADVDIEADNQLMSIDRGLIVYPNIKLLDEALPEYRPLLLKYSKNKETYIPKEKPKFYSSYKYNE